MQSPASQSMVVRSLACPEIAQCLREKRWCSPSCDSRCCGFQESPTHQEQPKQGCARKHMPFSGGSLTDLTQSSVTGSVAIFSTCLIILLQMLLSTCPGLHIRDLQTWYGPKTYFQDPRMFFKSLINCSTQDQPCWAHLPRATAAEAAPLGGSPACPCAPAGFTPLPGWLPQAFDLPPSYLSDFYG